MTEQVTRNVIFSDKGGRVLIEKVATSTHQLCPRGVPVLVDYREEYLAKNETWWTYHLQFTAANVLNASDGKSLYQEGEVRSFVLPPQQPLTTYLKFMPMEPMTVKAFTTGAYTHIRLAVPSATLPSPYRCRIPFDANTPRLCGQGNFGEWSHFDGSEYAFDFNMPEGTPILAATEGVVVETKEDSDQGGPDKAMMSFANYVIVQHADLSLAKYVHLRKAGVVAKEGQHVKPGDLIGYSGNTGWSTEPHLHFAIHSDHQRSIPSAFAAQSTGELFVPQLLQWIGVDGPLGGSASAATHPASPPPAVRPAHTPKPATVPQNSADAAPPVPASRPAYAPHPQRAQPPPADASPTVSPLQLVQEEAPPPPMSRPTYAPRKNTVGETSNVLPEARPASPAPQAPKQRPLPSPTARSSIGAAPTSPHASAAPSPSVPSPAPVAAAPPLPASRPNYTPPPQPASPAPSVPSPAPATPPPVATDATVAPALTALPPRPAYSRLSQSSSVSPLAASVPQPESPAPPLPPRKSSVATPYTPPPPAVADAAAAPPPVPSRHSRGNSLYNVKPITPEIAQPDPGITPPPVPARRNTLTGSPAPPMPAAYDAYAPPYVPAPYAAYAPPTPYYAPVAPVATAPYAAPPVPSRHGRQPSLTSPPAYAQGAYAYPPPDAYAAAPYAQPPPHGYYQQP